MNYCALGIETIGQPPKQIRTIGVARFRDYRLEGTWSCAAGMDSLGVADGTGEAQPAAQTMARLAEALAELGRCVGPGVVVHHSASVRTAVQSAARRQGVVLPPWTWLDSESLALLAWPTFQGRCSHLLSIARRLRIDCARRGCVDHAVATGTILARIAATAAIGLDRLAVSSPLAA